MKLHVTRTYTITTEHEVDLTNKTHDYVIATIVNLTAEHQCHEVIDPYEELDRKGLK